MKVEKRSLLTIQDLYKFCQENKLYNFNSKEQGYKLKVQVPSSFEVDENVDDAHRGMLKLKIRIFHTGLNRNGSFVSEEAAKEAMPTIKNRPVLAAIHQLDNGEWDFEGHNFEIITNEDGEEEIVYIEKQVGSFDESEPFFEYDEELDKTYICSYAYISEGYTKAADIIRRKQGTKNSVELSIDELSFNAKENYLSLDKFYVSASTLLGAKEDGTEIGEGMLGSRADIADFSEQNNTSQYDVNKELLDEIKKLNENLSHFNINQAELSANETFEEGGIKDVDNAKFLELLEKYNKTEANIEFEIEGLSDEELETKFAEVFGEESEEDPASEEGDEEEKSEEVAEESTEEENETEESETSEEDETSEEVVEDNSEETSEESAEEYALVEKKFEIDGKKFSVAFELSHDDIRCGLYNLLSVYDDLDNEWYGIRAVYDSYFVMYGWCTNKIYGQKYTVDGDNVAFDGERWELFEELLTASEKAELDSMRANYSLLEQFKLDTENAQLHSQREAILYNEKYSVLAEKDEENNYKNEAYAKLVSEMDNYSLTDLEKELKSVFADYITNGGQFSYADEQEEKSMVSKKLFATSTNKKPSRYGNLFSK